MNNFLRTKIPGISWVIYYAIFYQKIDLADSILNSMVHAQTYLISKIYVWVSTLRVSTSPYSALETFSLSCFSS